MTPLNVASTSPARKALGLAALTLTLIAGVGCAAVASPGPDTHLVAAKTSQTASQATGQVSGTATGSTTGTAYETPTHLPYVPNAKRDARPNVILITTDDETLTDMKWMPATRALLGDTGLTFNNMLSPHPLCCPARAEMMTGEYAQNNGVHTNSGPYGGLPALIDPDNTLPWWLQQNGYRTSMIGKYLNGYYAKTGVPRGWDYWNASTTNGFGYYGYSMYNNGHPTYFGKNAAAGNILSTDYIAQQTSDQIQQDSATDQPFFIWSSYYAPHGVCGNNEGCAKPPVADPKYADLYPDAINPASLKPSFNEDDVSDKPYAIRHLDKVDPAYEQYVFQQRIRALKSVDDAISQTIQTLKDTGELANTLIMFTSDNGYLLGEHRYHGKVLPYEEALRVPLLVTGPGVPVGETRGQPVTTVDLAPTILDVTGTEPGREQDGHSIWPFVQDKTLPRANDTILIQAGGHPFQVANPAPWMYRGVWTDRYTFVSWNAEHGFHELYDRDKDPYQLVNVAHDPAYASIVKILADRTRLLRDCSGEDCEPSFKPLPDPKTNR